MNVYVIMGNHKITSFINILTQKRRNFLKEGPKNYLKNRTKS